MGHHHELSLTGVMELRPDQLRHHPEILPRDSRNYVLTTYKSCSNNLVNTLVHIDLMPTYMINSHSYPMSNPY